MGGYFCVGIRRKDGSEYIAERHTNPLPGWVCDPEWWSGGKVIDRYIAAAKGERLFRPRKIVFPSEYGVVLFDFITKKVLSRQDYTSLVSSLQFADNAPHAKEYLALRDKGWIHRMECWPHDEPNQRGPRVMRNKEINSFWERIEAHAEDPRVSTRNGPIGMVELYWTPRGWQVDHPKGDSDKGYARWGDVRKFMKENGWKSPCWTPERVKKVYYEDRA